MSEQETKSHLMRLLFLFNEVFGKIAYFTYIDLKKLRSASVIPVKGAFLRRNV